jgi:hypothetical protein
VGFFISFYFIFILSLLIYEIIHTNIINVQVTVSLPVLPFSNVAKTAKPILMDFGTWIDEILYGDEHRLLFLRK